MDLLRNQIKLLSITLSKKCSQFEELLSNNKESYTNRYIQTNTKLAITNLQLYKLQRIMFTII